VKGSGVGDRFATEVEGVQGTSINIYWAALLFHFVFLSPSSLQSPAL